MQFLARLWASFTDANRENARLLAHLVGGAILFFMFALLAALLSLFIQWLSTWVNDSQTIAVLTWAKYGILVMDVVLLIIVGYRAIRHFWKGGRS